MGCRNKRQRDKSKSVYIQNHTYKANEIIGMERSHIMGDSNVPLSQAHERIRNIEKIWEKGQLKNLI